MDYPPLAPPQAGGNRCIVPPRKRGGTNQCIVPPACGGEPTTALSPPACGGARGGDSNYNCSTSRNQCGEPTNALSPPLAGGNQPMHCPPPLAGGLGGVIQTTTVVLVGINVRWCTPRGRVPGSMVRLALLGACAGRWRSQISAARGSGCHLPQGI